MPFPYTQQTWTDGVSQASAARFGVIEAGVALAGVVGTGSSPPGSPTDGMIWRYPVSTGLGCYWYFQYDSGQTTYKWVFMGGPPVFAYTAGDQAQSFADNVWANPFTTEPTFTPARGGDYLIRARASFRPATSGCTVWFGVRIGATDPTIDGLAACGAYCPVAAARQPMNVDFVTTSLAASTALTLRYRQSSGTTQNMSRSGAYLEVLPIRII